jgi:hypothetical protein
MHPETEHAQRQHLRAKGLSEGNFAVSDTLEHIEALHGTSHRIGNYFTSHMTRIDPVPAITLSAEYIVANAPQVMRFCPSNTTE